MSKILWMTLPALLAVATASGCLSQSYCERRAECEDNDDPDFVPVCRATYEGRFNALRANKEDVCHEVARAKEIVDSCSVANDSCGDFRDIGDGDYEGDCENENDDYRDALEEAGQECGILD